MGVNYLCCLIQSSPERRRRRKSCISSVQHVGSTSSTIDVSEPPAVCSKRDQSQSDSKKKVEAETETETEREMERWGKSSSATLTLRQCMLASPIMIKDQSPDQCATSSDLQITKQLPTKIYVTSPEPRKEFFTPSLGSPSWPRRGRLLKIGEEYEEVFSVSPVMRTSPGTTTDKGKRRVRFRSPKESVVVVFYSPATTPEQ